MSHSTARTAKDDVTIDFGAIELTGSLRHDDERRSLMFVTNEGPEHISVNLQTYNLTPGPGHIFVKDWSEHAGLTARLVAAGLVRVIRTVVVGPFASHAYEVEVTL